MCERILSNAVLIATTALGIVCLGWWFTQDPTADLEERVATPASAFAKGTEDKVVKIGELFARSDGTPADLPGAWPRFRGQNGDNISVEKVSLAESWGEKGPDVLWSVKLGEGYAGPAVWNGRVYVLDYDEEGKADVLRCFSLSDGREIWRRGYRVEVKRNHGMSRTVPAVTDQYVVTIGPKCHVMCVDSTSGDFLWGIDLTREYGTRVPQWYTGQCPLIAGSLAIIAPAGTETLIMAVDCATGKVVWKTPNPERWEMSHSSIVPMSLNGKRMYIYCAFGGMVGVSADGEDRGRILWQTTEWSHRVIVPSPVILEDGRIFVTTGYGQGSMMFKVLEDYSVQCLQKIAPIQGLASEQQTPIFYDGHLFGILPKDAGPLRSEFVCCHPDDCGKILWSSGRSNRFGLGPYAIADGKFFLLDDSGVLTMLKATAEGYVELDRAKVLDGQDSWGPIAIAGGRILIRDSKQMVCLNLRGK